MNIAQSNRAGLFFMLIRQAASYVGSLSLHTQQTKLTHTRDQVKQTNLSN